MTTAYIDRAAVNAYGRGRDNPFKTRKGAENLAKRDKAYAETFGCVLIVVQVEEKGWLVDCVETDEAKAERLARTGRA